MGELLRWVEQEPVRFVSLVAVGVIVARLVWRRLTRRYGTLSVADAASRLHDGRSLFLDVRTAREVRGGTIPGALPIPGHQLRRRLAELKAAPDTPIVVYCHSGVRSPSPAHLLTRRGFSEVYHLQGGLAAWRAQNLPIERHHD